MAHQAIILEPEEFLDHFFRSSTSPLSEERCRPRWDHNVFQRIEGARYMRIAELAERFITAVNLFNLAPGLKLAESQNDPEISLPDVEVPRQKTDAAFFRSDRVPSRRKPEWTDQLVSIVFLDDWTCDPFGNRSEDRESVDDLEREQIRALVICCAEQVFSYQHRTALYMLLIIGRRFRFLRWDRSGTLVTRTVDYVERPELLCELLWHMSRLTDEQLGVDPSAVRLRPGDPDYQRMDKLGRPNADDVDHTEREIKELPRKDQVFRYVRDAFRRSLSPDWPRYRLDVPDGDGTRQFLVGEPAVNVEGMAGRGTRGYVAYDCRGGRFVWLKDVWRAHYEYADQEGTMLEKLNKAAVRYVPTLVCHGDILEQVTQTPKYWELKNPPVIEPAPAPSRGIKRGRPALDDDEASHFRAEYPLRRHKHYRLVVEEVAMKLSAFQHGRQLLAIIYCCVKAHSEATTKAEMVHCDISAGNILILPRTLHQADDGRKFVKWSGLLVDWELSKPVNEKVASSRGRQPVGRAGTWQFMSVDANFDPVRPLETSDELESFLYVLLYTAVRYLRSNCTHEMAVSFIHEFFDADRFYTGQRHCGILKSAAMRDGKLVLPASPETQLQFYSPLDGFFDETLQWFKAHYKVRWEAQSAATPKVVAPAPDPALVRPWRRKNWDPEDMTDIVSTQDSLRATKTATAARTPTPEEKADALKVTTHAGFSRALVAAALAPGWMMDRASDVPEARFVLYKVRPESCVPEFKRRRTTSM